MTTKEAAKLLGVGPNMVCYLAALLGIPRKAPTWKGAKAGAYDLSEADVEAMRERRAKSAENRRAAAIERNARPDNPFKHMPIEERRARGRRSALAADPLRFGKKGHRTMQERAWGRQDRDHFGRVVAYEYNVAVAADPALSSELPGGPVFATIQWHAFYPVLAPDREDLSMWKGGQGHYLFGNHRSIDAPDQDGSTESSWLCDRLSVRAWHEHDRRRG